MPKLSPTMTSGVVVKWLVNENDHVSSGDVLVEIATDKAVLEYAAIDDGWIRQILCSENASVPVGKPIIITSSEKDEPFDINQLIEQEKPTDTQEIPSTNVDEAIDTTNQSTQKMSAISMPTFAPEEPLTTPCKFYQQYDKRPISPLAKQHALQNQLDTSNIVGSGPGGRIVKKDLAHAPKLSTFSLYPQTPPSCLPGSYSETPLSPMRKVIAERLSAAKQTIPHFYISQKINMGPVIQLRKELGEQELKFSINDFFIRACALALRSFPEVNAGFNSRDNKVVSFKTIDISIAVAIPDGLITPIIRCADYKPLPIISREIKMLAQKAKNMSLQEHEYKGGSFCVSNLGMTGISSFSAIINPPQAAILAIGGIVEEPIVVKNQMQIGSTCQITLSVDHRVIDGYPAALFIKKVQSLMETPSLLLLH